MMKGHRIFRYLVLTASAATSLSCGDYTRATSPQIPSNLSAPTLTVAASFSIVPRGTAAKAVKWSSSHQKVDQSVTAVIGPEGGSLSLPGADFSLSIPAGALTASTTITVVARGGSFVVYDMLPHGIQFLLPVTAVQGLRTTAIYGTAAGNSVRTAYLADGNDQVRFDGSVSPIELEAATTFHHGPQRVAESHVWILNHFSRYILISGVWTEVAD